jgi:toxin ParE1/3/4
MSRRVIRSELALSDLAELAEYIRQQSPGSALRFLDEAESTLHQLAAMPGIGERFVTENPVFQDLRCCNISKFRNYIIYYKPLADGIVVYRVLHAARDRAAVFGEDESSSQS